MSDTTGGRFGLETLVVDVEVDVVEDVVETGAVVVVDVVATVVVGGEVGSVDDPSQPAKNRSESAIPPLVFMVSRFSARARIVGQSLSK